VEERATNEPLGSALIAFAVQIAPTTHAKPEEKTVILWGGGREGERGWNEGWMDGRMEGKGWREAELGNERVGQKQPTQG
jgi:hypothetical protein